MANRSDRRNGEQLFMDSQSSPKAKELPKVCGELSELARAFFDAYADDRNFTDWSSSDLIRLADLARAKEELSLLQEKMRSGSKTLFGREAYCRQIDKEHREQEKFLWTRVDKLHGSLHLNITTEQAKRLKRGKTEFAPKDDDDSLLFGEGDPPLPH